MAAVLASAFESPQRKNLGNEPVRRMTGPDIKSAALLKHLNPLGDVLGIAEWGESQ